MAMRTYRLGWKVDSRYLLDESLIGTHGLDAVGVVEDMMRWQLYHYICDELGVPHRPHNEVIDAIMRKATFTDEGSA